MSGWLREFSRPECDTGAGRPASLNESSRKLLDGGGRQSPRALPYPVPAPHLVFLCVSLEYRQGMCKASIALPMIKVLE